MITAISAIGYTILMGIVIIFQFCLAIGLPWGEASMGGKFPGKYPPKMRVVSIINIFILSFITLIVLTKANFILPQYKSFSDAAIYFVVGFSAVTFILNSITPSKIEKKIWAPVTFVQLIFSLIVAFVDN
jgi:hypothetical protein